MKQKFLLLSFFALFYGITNAQTVRASLGSGSTPNSIKIYLRPDITISTPFTASTIQFDIGISTSVTPTPTATLIPTTTAPFNTTVFRINKLPNPEGGFIHFAIDNVSFPLVTTVANTDLEVCEVRFAGGPVLAQNVSLVCLPDGGSDANFNAALFYFTSTVLNSNGQSLFYAKTPSVTIVNGNSYRSNTQSGTQTSSATISNISLPTKFLSFFATKNDDVANLTWTVDNEENNAYFEVERSLDGRNFSKAYQVQALHNGRSSNSYTTPDANISRLGVKTIYYRIKQFENSGQMVYSEIRQINLTDKNFSASLYPNPVKTSTKLIIDAPEAGKATVVIRDAAGKTVKTISLQLVQGINQQQLDASMFAAGDYNVTIVSEKLNQTIKMTKAN